MASALTLGRMLNLLTGHALPGPEQVVTDAVVDSRHVVPGSLFVALPGERVDGHEFVQEAFNRGALAALIEHDISLDVPTLDLTRPVAVDQLEPVKPPLCLRVSDSLEALQTIARGWRDELDVRVIGITGSVGKSTTKELTAEILGRRYRTLKNPGNLNNEIGLPLTLLGLKGSHERVVLEMGFYVPGEIAFLCQIAKPQVGVVTNLSQVHMERAGSMEAIVRGKRELVESLPPAPDGIAILNHDEPLVRQMAESTQAAIFFYGLSPMADLWASDIEGLGLEGVRFILHYGQEELHVRVPLLGRHSVHTALRATAVGLAEDLTWEEIVGGLQRSRSQLRLVAVPGPRDSILLDDTYNAAPTSTIAALNLLEELDGRKVAVLGDMFELGEFEERGHRMVGVRAAQVADALIAVGERARWIADEARRAGMPADRIIELADAAAAAEYLRDRVNAGDVVLIKGSRGMHMDEIVTSIEANE